LNKKTNKNKKTAPHPKINQQIPNSLIRSARVFEPAQDLKKARNLPFYGCWIMAGWHEQGITAVIVARIQASGKIIFGAYMIDLYCLGIKDAYIKSDISPRNFDRLLPKLCSEEPEKCSIELAHEVIYGGMEYAEKLGFQPSPAFRETHADLLLDLPDSHPRLDHVAFGMDGKPFFISGPYDNERKIQFVIDTLNRTVGEGNFTLLLGSPSDLF